MEANELRIGNYYQYAGDNGIIYTKVKEIKHNQFGLLGDFDGVNFEICKPIELTEEWLFKFGFEIGYNQKKMLDVYCKDFDFLIERSNGGNFYYKKVNIKSVHQLQNLYFALVGEELTFKSE